MTSSIEGQSSEVPELLVGKRKNNFFVYDSDHKLLFEGYSENPIIETSKTDMEIKLGRHDEEYCIQRFTESHEYTIEL